MSDGTEKKVKRYYWLKLKRDFFKRHDIEIIEGMENGKEYVLFYLKLLLESIDHEGMLRFSDTVPYDAKMLASVTHTNIDTVKSALQKFYELGLVELWDDKTLFMSGVQKMIGTETDSAERMRKMRERKNAVERKNDVPLLVESSESSHCDTDVRKCDTEIEYRYKSNILDNNNPPIIPPLGEKGNTHEKVEKDTKDKSKKKETARDLLDSKNFSPNLRRTVEEWALYKKERKQSYQPTGFKSLLTQVENNVSKYGEEAVIEVIQMSMGQNWQGIAWSKLKDNHNTSGKWNGYYGEKSGGGEYKWTERDLEESL